MPHLHIRLAALLAGVVASLSCAGAAWAGQGVEAPKVGDVFEMVRSYETSEQSSDGMTSSSSSGSDALRERVVAVRDGGLELEYDLLDELTAEDRARQWQFPARVFKARDGSVVLLNRPELEARIGRWLEAGQLTRADCGRAIFTWRVFSIDCDPQSVIGTISTFDPASPPLREGEAFRDADALGPGPVVRRTAGPNRVELQATMKADPNVIRRVKAEADVAVGELMRQPVTLEAALKQRAAEQIAGTITVTVVTDGAGIVLSRTKVTEVKTLAEGVTHTRLAEETVERQRVVGGGARE